jgi:serine/threonine-protein kinase
MLGTPDYMSPEQVRDAKDVDVRTDVYALGVVLYEALSGKRPFCGETFYTLAAAIVKGEYEPLGRLVPELDPQLASVVARAMHRERDERFESVRDFQRELLPFAHVVRSSAPPNLAADLAQGKTVESNFPPGRESSSEQPNAGVSTVLPPSSHESEPIDAGPVAPPPRESDPPPARPRTLPNRPSGPGASAGAGQLRWVLWPAVGLALVASAVTAYRLSGSGHSSSQEQPADAAPPSAAALNGSAVAPESDTTVQWSPAPGRERSPGAPPVTRTRDTKAAGATRAKPSPPAVSASAASEAQPTPTDRPTGTRGTIGGPPAATASSTSPATGRPASPAAGRSAPAATAKSTKSPRAEADGLDTVNPY